ncbi:hypothetical protein BKA93DRAFT_760333 [Sparassis latifolia]
MESHYRSTKLAKGPEVLPLMYGVFDIERSFESAPFSQFGSLYFKDDVDRPGMCSFLLAATRLEREWLRRYTSQDVYARTCRRSFHNVEADHKFLDMYAHAITPSFA